MLKSINFKKLTVNTLIGILLAGGLTVVESETKKALANSCNNGHGNNPATSITLNSETITVEGYDPSNPGNKRSQLIDLLQEGKTSGNGMTITYSNGPYNLIESQAIYVADHLPDLEANCVVNDITSTDSPSITSEPVGIDSLDFTRVNATSSTSEVCEGGNCADKNYGTGTNIKLNGFTVGDKNYSILQLVDRAKFQRVDNSNVSGVRHIYFLETGDNNSIGSSAVFTMEDAIRSDFINGGTDNVFANTGGININNIERIDFLINSGLIVKEGYVNDAGFLLLERKGNDSIKIAAIKGLDASGNPNQFGTLIDLPQSTWGNSGINIKTTVFQNQSNWSAPKLTTSLGGQKIHGIFVSIGSLGIDSGETIYGYAVFPGDIDSSNDLVGLSDFPDNTPYSGTGGLDLISSGGLFIPDGVTKNAVFEPASAVNDEATTDEDSSVSGNVLTNDVGDSLTVITTGQQTLESGALVTINSDGTFTYNPNNQFESLNDNETATDTFLYTMRDGSGNTSSATVTITINGITDIFAD